MPASATYRTDRTRKVFVTGAARGGALCRYPHQMADPPKMTAVNAATRQNLIQACWHDGMMLGLPTLVRANGNRSAQDDGGKAA